MGRVTEVDPVVRRERALVGEKVIASPPPKVMELVAKVVLSLAVKVFPSAMVRVEPVSGAVNATLFTLVALATPIFGVTREGDVSKTRFPVPVVPVTEAKRFAEVMVFTRFFEASVATSREAVRPERLTKPVPKVTGRLVVVLIPKVAETPFASMTGVAEVRVTLPERESDVPLAAPIFGVTRVGEVANTAAPVPVSSESEVANWREVMEPVAVP